ncbi:MAG: radical SAM/SPASM domain-containing protein [Cyanobacteriota bacterium]
MIELFKRKSFDKTLPKIFVIETSLICDLKCPECALGSSLINRPKGVLSFEKFEIIANKIKPLAEKTYLIIWGEPLLNKDIFKIIKKTSTFSQTNISTNANTLTEENAIEIINSGLSDIVVSIDAVTQQTYEKYRVGGNFEKVLSNLKMLNELNIKHGQKVRIIPQFIVFKHNQHELEEFKNICKSLELKPFIKAPYIRRNSIFANSGDSKFIRKKYKNEKQLKKAMKQCPDARNTFTILLDGSVVLCCYDHNSIMSFGNIFEQDVLEIWNSDKYKEYRWNILNGSPPHFCMENCLQYCLE